MCFVTHYGLFFVFTCVWDFFKAVFTGVSTGWWEDTLTGSLSCVYFTLNVYVTCCELSSLSCGFVRQLVLCCYVSVVWWGWGWILGWVGCECGMTFIKEVCWWGGVWRGGFFLSAGFQKFCSVLWYVHHSGGCFLCTLHRCKIAPMCSGVCFLCGISILP